MKRNEEIMTETMSKRCKKDYDESKTSFFDDTPDMLIADISCWLLSRTIVQRPSPDMSNMRDLMRFSMTCKRIHRTIISSDYSYEMWSIVDIGKLIDDRDVKRKLSRFCEETVTSRNIIEKIVALPQISMCLNLSLIYGLTNAHILALIRSMPRLRTLELELYKREKCTESLGLTETVVGSRNVLEAIKTLCDLDSLSIITTRDHSMDLTWLPRKLRRFERIDLSQSTTNESLGRVFRDIENFSNLISLSIITPKIFTDNDLDDILRTCTRLEELEISEYPHGNPIALFMDSFSRNVVTVKNLKKLSLDISSVAWNIICDCCPNLIELHMSTTTAPATSCLRKLSKLRILEICCKCDCAVLCELKKFGHSDGVPLTRLELQNVECDLGELFSMPRCSELRELVITKCVLRSSHFASTDIFQSLVSVTMDSFNLRVVLKLLTSCRRLEHLVILDSHPMMLYAMGKACTAPLKYVKLCGEMTKDSLVAFVSSLQDIFSLELYVSKIDNSVTESIVDSFSNRPKIFKIHN